MKRSVRERERGWKKNEMCLFIEFNGFGFLFSFLFHCRLSGFFNFRMPTYILRDPELYKQIAIKNFDSFVDHRFIIEPQMDSLMGNTLFLMRGEKWRKMRTTLTPAFTGCKMRRMFDLVRECAIDSRNYLIERVFDDIGSEQVIELAEFYSRVTNDMIASCAFGLKINSLIDRNNEFYETGATLQHLHSVKSFMKILCLRTFPWLMDKFQYQFVDKKIRDVFSKLVLRNIKNRRLNQIVRPDLIDLLMRAKNDGQNGPWSDDEIISQAFIFFLAGFDTTMWVLIATTYELALNQRIQQRLIDEIDAMNDKLSDQLIGYDDLNKMKYLDMVIMEVLRLHSPAVLIDRLCSKRIQLNVDDKIKINIEKGDHIWIPIYCFHHNPEYFSQPELFDPERFNDENKKNINQAHYVPFGIGPRACIGNRFAIMEVKGIIYYMLSQFKFNISSKTEIPMKIKSSPFGLNAANGLYLSMKRRK